MRVDSRRDVKRAMDLEEESVGGRRRERECKQETGIMSYEVLESE